MTDTGNTVNSTPPEDENSPAGAADAETVDISDAARAAEAGAEAAPNEQNSGAVDDATAELQAKADENWEKYVRAVAELDNVRKRAQRDVEQAHKFGTERLLNELLAVADSLEGALAAGEQASAESLLEGSAATLKILLNTLEKFGVQQIDPAGAPFDPQEHEAMTMVPSPDAEPNSVIDVVQKGYSLNGRLVRAARVVVAADPS
ncbi:MAG: nucleotide exchange factor GrpE [Pseudomonadota bacterium]